MKGRREVEREGIFIVGPCSVCGSIEYNEDYDAYYCPNCNKWLEDECGDPECEFCSGRPEKPL
jgi:hypothetical protein